MKKMFLVVVALVAFAAVASAGCGIFGPTKCRDGDIIRLCKS